MLVFGGVCNYHELLGIAPMKGSETMICFVGCAPNGIGETEISDLNGGCHLSQKKN